MRWFLRLTTLAVISFLMVPVSPATASAPDGGGPCPAPCPAEVITVPPTKVVVQIPPPEVSFRSPPAPAHRHSLCNLFKHHHHKHEAPIVMPFSYAPMMTMPVMSAPTYSFAPMAMQAPVMAAPVYSAPAAPVYSAPAAPVYSAPVAPPMSYAPSYVPQYAPQAPAAPQAAPCQSADTFRNAAASLAAMQAYQQAAAKLELDSLEERKQALQGQIKAMAPYFPQAPQTPSGGAAAQEKTPDISKVTEQVNRLIGILESHKERLDGHEATLKDHEERLKKLEKK